MHVRGKPKKSEDAVQASALFLWQVPFADKNGIENHRAIKIRNNKVKQDRICL